jgi:hypothetical protein
MGLGTHARVGGALQAGVAQRRTDGPFACLIGFLIPASVYWERLRPYWPRDAFFARNPAFPTHPREWDDYVRTAMAVQAPANRSAPQHGCLYPEVSRGRHVRDPDATPAPQHDAGGGGEGPHSTTAAVQTARFDPMRTATAALSLAAFMAALAPVAPVGAYDKKVVVEVGAGARAATLDAAALAAVLPWPPTDHALVYMCSDCVQGHPEGGPAPPREGDGWTDLLGGHLGLLARGPDGVVRGHYRGAVAVRWLGYRLWLVARDSPWWDTAARARTTADLRLRVPWRRGRPPLSIAEATALLAGPAGMSCTAACVAAGRVCADALLPLANRPAALAHAFGLVPNGSSGSSGSSSSSSDSDACHRPFTALLHSGAPGWDPALGPVCAPTPHLACDRVPPPALRRLCPCVHAV